MSETRKLPELVVTKGGVPFEDQAEGIRQFKEACLAASPAGAPDGIWMPFDVLEQIGAEITSLRAQLDEARKEVKHFASLAFDDLGKNPPVAWKDIAQEAKRKSIEECAAIAETHIHGWEQDEYTAPAAHAVRKLASSEIAQAIRALLSESKT